jgi:hypothetical protein
MMGGRRSSAYLQKARVLSCVILAVVEGVDRTHP